nr:MAG TPA: hypothetical protein [Caudoviricetes sp.]
MGVLIFNGVHIGFSPMKDSSSLTNVLSRCTIIGRGFFRVEPQ